MQALEDKIDTALGMHTLSKAEESGCKVAQRSLAARSLQVAVRKMLRTRRSKLLHGEDTVIEHFRSSWNHLYETKAVCMLTFAEALRFSAPDQASAEAEGTTVDCLGEALLAYFRAKLAFKKLTIDARALRGLCKCH